MIFEATYDTFQEHNTVAMFDSVPNGYRSKLCCIIHSVPATVTGRKFRRLVKDARKVADEVFVTHLSEDYYASFDSRWGEFVKLMAS